MLESGICKKGNDGSRAGSVSGQAKPLPEPTPKKVLGFGLGWGTNYFENIMSKPGSSLIGLVRIIYVYPKKGLGSVFRTSQSPAYLPATLFVAFWSSIATPPWSFVVARASSSPMVDAVTMPPAPLLGLHCCPKFPHHEDQHGAYHVYHRC